MFLIRQRLGFRRKRRGWPVLLLMAGLFACLGGCPLALFGAPYSLYRARQVAALPRPAPTHLSSTAPGTALLITAQLLPQASTNAHGLALYYIETRPTQTQGTRTPKNNASTWQLKQVPPPMVEMQLTNGDPLTVQIPAEPSFLNAQRIESPALTTTGSDEVEAELRYTGYLPGQTLTIEGAWQGDQRLIAQTFYAGTAADYLNFLTYTQPGAALLMGAFCSGVGGLLLAAAGIMWVLG